MGAAAEGEGEGEGEGGERGRGGEGRGEAQFNCSPKCKYPIKSGAVSTNEGNFHDIHIAPTSQGFLSMTNFDLMRENPT